MADVKEIETPQDTPRSPEHGKLTKHWGGQHERERGGLVTAKRSEVGAASVKVRLRLPLQALLPPPPAKKVPSTTTSATCTADEARQAAQYRGGRGWADQRGEVGAEGGHGAGGQLVGALPLVARAAADAALRGEQAGEELAISADGGR